MGLPPARVAAAGGHTAQAGGWGLHSGPQPAPRPGAGWELGKATDPRKSRCLFKSSGGRVNGKWSRSLWESCGEEGLAGWAAVLGEPRSAFLPRQGCSGRRVPFLHKRAAFHQVLPRRNLGRAFVSCREATYYAPYLTNCWNRLIV